MLLTKLKGITATVIVVLGMALGATTFSYLALGQNQSEGRKVPETQKGPASGPVQKKTQQRKRELDLTGRSDLTHVDLEKRIVTGHELIGGDNFKIVGDCWRLSVMPNTEIIIDGKKAKLDDLHRVVQAVRPGHFIKVIGEWEFEALKPRYSTQDGRANRIEVWGEQMDGITQAIGVEKRIISITRSFGDGTTTRIPHEVAKDAKVLINGKEAMLSDLKPNMRVSLQMSAVKNAPVVGVTALGPKVEGLIRMVNAEKNAVTVHIPEIQMTVEDALVAKDATVIIDGKVRKLSDLRTGMPVTLQMCAEIDKGNVVGITARKPVKDWEQ